jgi:predicted transcriptional regulator
LNVLNVSVEYDDDVRDRVKEIIRRLERRHC